MKKIISTILALSLISGSSVMSASAIDMKENAKVTDDKITFNNCRPFGDDGSMNIYYKELTISSGGDNQFHGKGYLSNHIGIKLDKPVSLSEFGKEFNVTTEEATKAVTRGQVADFDGKTFTPVNLSTVDGKLSASKDKYEEPKSDTYLIITPYYSPLTESDIKEIYDNTNVDTVYNGEYAYLDDQAIYMGPDEMPTAYYCYSDKKLTVDDFKDYPVKPVSVTPSKTRKDAYDVAFSADDSDTNKTEIYDNGIFKITKAMVEDKNIKDFELNGGTFSSSAEGTGDFQKLDVPKHIEKLGEATINTYASDPTKDGQITAEDATKILIDFAHNIAKDNDYDYLKVREGDANDDGQITAEDATDVLIYFANKIIK